MVSGKCGAAWLKLELVPTTRQSRRSQASARQNGTSYFDAPMTHCSSHRRLLQQNLPRADLHRSKLRRLITSSVGTSSVGGTSTPSVFGRTCYEGLSAQAGSGVDCQATNFQPWGVFVQALRNNSLRLRGWPPMSASIPARPVMSATSPKTRTLRSRQFAALYFVLPDFIESSQLGLVSVLPEECV